MKTLTRKLFISIFTAVFALVALGTTTYAWFTISTTAKLDAIAFNSRSGEGIRVAVVNPDFDESANVNFAGVTWYTGNIPNSAIISAMYATNFAGARTANPIVFDAVSYASGSGSTALQAGGSILYSGMQYFKKLKAGTGAQAAAENVDYVAVDFVFTIGAGITLGSQSMKISVDQALLHNTGTPSAFTVDNEFDLTSSVKAEIGNTVTTDLTAAMRIAFVDETSGTTPHFVTFEGAAIAPSNASASALTSGNTLGIGTGGATAPTNFGALSYFKAKQGLDYTTYLLPCENTQYALQNLIDTTKTTHAALTVKPEMPTRITTTDLYVRVRCFIWVEGWDNECMISIFNQQAQVGFVFNGTLV